jgi:hypothetical protein
VRALKSNTLIVSCAFSMISSRPTMFSTGTCGIGSTRALAGIATRPGAPSRASTDGSTSDPPTGAAEGRVEIGFVVEASPEVFVITAS